MSDQSLLKNSQENNSLFASSDRFIPFLAMYLVILNILLFYALLYVWPVKGFAFAKSVGVELDLLYLVIVIICGGIGSSIYLCVSFSDYVGNGKFKKSWGIWYLLRPFIGMALAVIAYFVIRAGLLGASGDSSNLNPYGICAMASLVGMFSRQASDKLREIFDNIFSTTTPIRRSDSLNTSKKSDTIRGTVEEILGDDLLKINVVERGSGNKYEYSDEEMILIANTEEDSLKANDDQSQKDHLEHNVKGRTITCKIITRNLDKHLLCNVTVI